MNTEELIATVSKVLHQAIIISYDYMYAVDILKTFRKSRIESAFVNWNTNSIKQLIDDLVSILSQLDDTKYISMIDSLYQLKNLA